MCKGLKTLINEVKIMSLKLQNSLSSLDAIRNFNIAMEKAQESQTRISTGKKINSASDNPSASSIATFLNVQAKSLEAASSNVSNATSLIQVADSSLSGMITLVQDIKSKANEASSALLSSSSKKTIQTDITNTLDGLDTIAKTTSFNGFKLLDGSFENKTINIGAYAGESTSLSVDSSRVKDLVSANLGTIELKNITSFTAVGATSGGYTLELNLASGGTTKIEVAQTDLAYDGTTNSIDKIIAAINDTYNTHGVKAYQKNTGNTEYTFAMSEVPTAANDVNLDKITINGTTISLGTVAKGSSLTKAQAATNAAALINAQTSKTHVVAVANGDNLTIKTKEEGNSMYVNVRDSGGTAYTALKSFGNATTVLGTICSRGTLGTIQLVANNGLSLGSNTTQKRGVNDTTADATALENIEIKTLSDLSVSTQNDAQTAMILSDFALEALNTNRSNVGAQQRSLETITSNIATTKDNILAAVGNITDIDFAAESLNFANFNTLVQTSAYALSQAKANSQIILTLLK